MSLTAAVNRSKADGTGMHSTQHRLCICVTAIFVKVHVRYLNYLPQINYCVIVIANKLLKKHLSFYLLLCVRNFYDYELLYPNANSHSKKLKMTYKEEADFEKVKGVSS